MQFKILANLVLIAVPSVLGAKMESNTQVDEAEHQEVSEAPALNAHEMVDFKQLLTRIADFIEEKGKIMGSYSDYVLGSTGTFEHHKVYPFFLRNVCKDGKEPEYLEKPEWKESQKLLKEFARIVEEVLHTDTDIKEKLVYIKENDIPNWQQQMEKNPAFEGCRLLEIANKFVDERRQSVEA
jgi:hypothetical protein